MGRHMCGARTAKELTTFPRSLGSVRVTAVLPPQPQYTGFSWLQENRSGQQTHPGHSPQIPLESSLPLWLLQSYTGHLMFSNGTGHRICGGIFYNVGGDVNLRNHHNLTIQNCPADFQPLADSVWKLNDAGQENSPQYQRTPCEWKGVVGSTRHSAATEPGLYNAGSRHRHPGISLNDALVGERSSGPSSSASIPSSRGPLAPFPSTPYFNCPLSSTYSSWVPSLKPFQPDTSPPSIHGDEALPAEKRHRREEDGVKVIRSKNLKLICEIGSGPGYFLHTGQNKGHAVIVKVFNRSPTVRQQLESTVAVSKGIMHPNVLRLMGVSSPTSSWHFLVYENVHWKNAEGPLAAALQNDLTRSITLGFKMVAGLSAGMNHLCVQGLSPGLMGVENFDIFLDVEDRFLICINPRPLEEVDAGGVHDPEDAAWIVFNGLCQKVLMSANHALYHEQINRDPAIMDVIPLRSASRNVEAPSLPFVLTAAPQNIEKEELEEASCPTTPRICVADHRSWTAVFGDGRTPNQC
ncbi:hypothetical protein MVEN_01184000 [Mycena venus]|uniref:Protein kinase domain-containing protein n=1 Tax=Mycena venus TaxID=2733690 RepID=A0A8H6Y5I4_9AGAR|nr:hypothetical protein MVEN_01184000 [Mycena venus]